MNFDVNTPIDTVFNDVEELRYISTTTIIPYTNQKYIKLDYNIINKSGQYKISIREWNRKDTANKNWAAIKANVCTAHQELKDVSDKTMVDTSFQSAHIVAQGVEGLENMAENRQ